MAKLTYIKQASQLLCMDGGRGPRKGRELSRLGVIADGSVIIENGVIVFCGSDTLAELFMSSFSKEALEKVEVIDARGMVAAPGLIDPHTHAVYAGSRENELEMRLHGAKYLDILKQGGGILSTARQTREASADALVLEAKSRLDRFLLHGVTTVEVKSGYGLTVQDELKQLQVIRSLDRIHPVDVIPTFMGAHAIPAEYAGRPDDYVRLVIEEMLPAVAEGGLAEFCDVFCEQGVFSISQTARILEAAAALGLKLKLHADEIAGGFGGAELAASLRAVSADHLLKVSQTGIDALSHSGTVAVLLPGTAFFLMEPPAPARALIEAGVPVALATDCNPGTSPTCSLPFVMNTACLTMGMTPAEVLTACTINAAYAVGRASSVGSLEAGKKGDVVLFQADNFKQLQYYYGMNLVDTVIKNGEVVVRGGILVG
ncbi:imidazolonepropionase [Paenibacillus sp. HN-1]|uniref:imidazolonepropionase n=1 Tax=Paenibacillus TaxID=44249 RepID=UPI001CA8AD7F|nr:MULTISPECIES: imidazolonepropionase [Paenibacillus]MBY9078019.1 imidazolonepropionase [Paenibacillus sp. CGMCC 1.18879]MBY9083760.1 imidazolonepropionase [Paenibacillus sinensis]